MRYVIVGNSAAAAGCVEGIRSLDQAGEIAILSSEPYHIYSRPLISYLLLGKTDEERMRYRPADYYEVNGCRFLPGVTAQAVDPVKKEVATADGQRLPYDKLLLATGSKPFVPPMAGLETAPRRFSFLSLDDAKALRAALTPASRVLILGGGLIGLKCAEGISGQVASITVVDLAPQILPSILDQEAAAIVRAHVEGQGVSFRLGRSVQSFAGDQALLTDGESLTFDILVLAVGVRPNTDLAAAAGCQVERGLLIDGQGRTSVADIYGAGDCCQGWDITTDSSRVLALLPNAYAQGEAAGIAMAGGDKAFDRGMPMNAIGFWGLHLLTAGSYEGESYYGQAATPGTDAALSGKAPAAAYKRLVVRDNRLVGFILIGDVACAGIYTALIRERTPLDTVDFDLIRERPRLIAFSKVERAKMLGGAAS